MSSAVQCLGFFLLSLKVLRQGGLRYASVQGRMMCLMPHWRLHRSRGVEVARIRLCEGLDSRRFGFVCSAEVKYQKSVAGMSSRTLEMYVLFFLFRLGSTLFKNGYLPVDRSQLALAERCMLRRLIE